MCLTDKSIHLKANSIITYSMDIDSYRQQLLQKYALAQYHLGIKTTLAYKFNEIGNQSLDKVPINKLEKLINIYRKLYNQRNK